MEKQSNLSAGEWKLMKQLWTRSPMTVREDPVQKALGLRPGRVLLFQKGVVPPGRLSLPAAHGPLGLQTGEHGSEDDIAELSAILEQAGGTERPSPPPRPARRRAGSR